MTSVDIVIPNYNYGRYLRECRSKACSAQDVEQLRVLIIDNASTDNSAEIAREFARTDPRVQVRVHDRNLGLHASFNEGIGGSQRGWRDGACVTQARAPASCRQAASA